MADDNATLYTSLWQIRQLAQLTHDVDDSLDGDVNGTNKKFYYEGRIVSQDDDDQVSTGDVNVSVDNKTVKVGSLDPQDREITLVNAPAVGTKVTAHFFSSQASDGDVGTVRSQSLSYVQGRLAKKYNFSQYDEDNLPPALIGMLTAQYAAGLFLVRNHSFSVDSSDIGLSGGAMIKAVNTQIDDLLGISASSQDTSNQAAALIAQPTQPFSTNILDN